jgi:hypothetical protein
MINEHQTWTYLDSEHVGTVGVCVDSLHDLLFPVVVVSATVVMFELHS